MNDKYIIRTANVDRMIAFLSDRNSYPHHPSMVKIIQTHASIIALVPPFVYKVKKHVNFGFLDFTTLEKRKNNCDREIQLNSRLCPSIYLDVLPITLLNNELAFDGAGEIVDYAVQMKQLADGYFLNQLIKKENITKEDLLPVIQCLKQFYSNQKPDDTILAFGEVEKIKFNTDENFNSLEGFTGEVIVKPALDAIRFFTDDFFVRFADLFKKRVKEHRIIDGHGDLHLDHIHLQEGKVCIYDCIEFNDRFRYLDVANDIAFLAMDIDFHGKPNLSAEVTNAITMALEDPDMNLLMDFYKCYRACVRTKVESISSLEKEIDNLNRKKSRDKANRYFNLAMRYAIFGSQPAVIIFMGRIASGKSTLAENVARCFGWKYCSSDIIRKRDAGLKLNIRTSDEKKRELYSKEATEHVYGRLLKEAITDVAKGQGVILDATFNTREKRNLFIREFEQKEVPYYFIEATASDEVIKQRLKERDKNSSVISDARLEDFPVLSASYREPHEVSQQHLIKVNTELNLEDNLLFIFKNLIRANYTALKYQA